MSRTKSAPGKKVRLFEKVKGLVILGSESFSGKTVVMVGLAKVLQEGGYNLRAIKPICIGSPVITQAELTFISQVSQSPLNYAVNCIDYPGKLSLVAWQNSLDTCLHVEQPTFVELPGSSATPLVWLNDPKAIYKDCRDFACELAWPCLLVARYGLKTLEQFMLHIVYLQQRGLEVIGLVTVKTTPEPMNDGLYYPYSLDVLLTQKTGIPYLGCIPYSQSISVNDVNQGNLVKLTSSALDLLPLANKLGLPLREPRVIPF